MATTPGESKRSAFAAAQPISRDVVVPEYPELGLIAFDSPNDRRRRSASRAGG